MSALARWRRGTQTSARQLGRRLGVSHTSVLNYERGVSIPRPQIMRRIRKITRGAVQPGDFYPA